MLCASSEACDCTWHVSSGIIVKGLSCIHATADMFPTELSVTLVCALAAGPPGNATAPADTHQKFMAALAKAALAQVHPCTTHTHCTHSSAPVYTKHDVKYASGARTISARDAVGLLFELSVLL